MNPVITLCLGKGINIPTPKLVFAFRDVIKSRFEN